MWDKAGNENRKLFDIKVGKSEWGTEFQIDCYSPSILPLTRKVTLIENKDRNLAVNFVPAKIRSNFYDIFKIIEKNFADNESEGLIAEDAEINITEGGQRDKIGSNIVTLLGIELTEKSVTRAVSEASETESTSEMHYIPVQRKYINCLFSELKGLFERKGAFESCEVRTHLHDLLRPVHVQGKRVSIH